MFGKKKGYAVKWTSYHNPRGGQRGGFKSKNNAQRWLNSYASKGPESGVRGKVVKERMRQLAERILATEADNSESPSEYAKDFLPGGIWHSGYYDWEHIIEEVNSYYDLEYPITPKIFKDLTGITPEEYEHLVEISKEKAKIDDQIDDLEWDISSLEYFLEEDKVHLAKSHDAIIELLISLKHQLETLQGRKKALDEE